MSTELKVVKQPFVTILVKQDYAQINLNDLVIKQNQYFKERRLQQFILLIC